MTAERILVHWSTSLLEKMSVMGTTLCSSLHDLIDPDWIVEARETVRPILQIGSIEVTGQQVAIAVGDEDIDRVYAAMTALALRAGQSLERAMLAVVGPPGSGKSVFAQLLTRAVAALDADRHVNPVCIGLDGFHLPNDTLTRRTIALDGEGSVSLRLYKGAELTYDVDAAKARLDEIRRSPGSPVTMPVYDRRLHEPVADGAVIPASCRLVIMEGNYLLLDEGDWQGMADRFDLTVYLDLSDDDCKPGLIARHVRGGRDEVDAEQHYQRVDLRNARVIETTRPRADLVVMKRRGHRATDVHVQNPQRVGEFL